MVLSESRYVALFCIFRIGGEQLPLTTQGNHGGLQELRRSIQERIDALESFYIHHVDDERAMLFEKQRLKLRKMLHEVPAAAGGAVADKTRSRRVREDSRLALDELRAWLEGGGAKNMRGLTDELIVAVYEELSRGQPDGKLSPRDFRSWYLSFGRNGATPDNLFPTMRKSAKSKVKKLPTIRGPLYDWEKPDEGGDELEETQDIMGLPGNVLEFQIVLTEEEYKAVLMKRRSKQAEMKYRQRLAAAKATRQRSAAKEEKLRASSTLTAAGPYVDPADIQTHIFRTSDTDKWLTEDGFER
jgi:hypothetical protein